MVMVVFALPGFDVVFKVIRDRFPPPKTVTAEEVREKYRLVFRHDRAGRLVDAQEFEHLEFPRERLSPALLEELATSASERWDRGATVVLRHLYTERRLIPLDVFLLGRDSTRRGPPSSIMAQVMRDLAATNIFPGDMLLKNFGVSRHGRADLLRLRRALPAHRLPLPRPAAATTTRRKWRSNRGTSSGKLTFSPKSSGPSWGLRRRAAGIVPRGAP